VHDRVASAAGARVRLREHRPADRGRELEQGHRAVRAVPGHVPHDQGAPHGPGERLDELGDVRCRGWAGAPHRSGPGPPGRTAVEGLGERGSEPWHERFAERDVAVHRSGGGTHPAGLRPRPAHRGAPVADRRRVVLGDTDLAEPPDGVTVELHLVDGLVRCGVPQLRWPVGGEDDERHPPAVGLDHRGEEVRGRGARRAHHRGGTTAAAGEPQREERRGALVDADVDAHPVVGQRRHREGSRA
jgi:hypothetical protein